MGYALRTGICFVCSTLNAIRWWMFWHCSMVGFKADVFVLLFTHFIQNSIHGARELTHFRNYRIKAEAAQNILFCDRQTIWFGKLIIRTVAAEEKKKLQKWKWFFHTVTPIFWKQLNSCCFRSDLNTTHSCFQYNMTIFLSYRRYDYFSFSLFSLICNEKQFIACDFSFLFFCYFAWIGN